VAPRFAPAHYSTALILDTRGQTDLVIQELTAAINSDPTYLPADSHGLTCGGDSIARSNLG
jgi:hypothetical protein